MPEPIPTIETALWFFLLNSDIPEPPSLNSEKAGWEIGFHRLSDEQLEGIRKVLEDCKIQETHFREGSHPEGKFITAFALLDQQALDLAYLLHRRSNASKPTR
jgi:hypothetical protein